MRVRVRVQCIGATGGAPRCARPTWPGPALTLTLALALALALTLRLRLTLRLTLRLRLTLSLSLSLSLSLALTWRASTCTPGHDLASSSFLTALFLPHTATTCVCTRHV